MIQIIGWTILHSLWQIALIVSLYLLMKNSWQLNIALNKYYLAVGTLATSFLTTLLTFGYLFYQNLPFYTPITDSPLTTIANEVPTTIIPIESNEMAFETTLTWMDYITLCLPYLVTFWVLGLVYFTIRFLLNLHGVKKLQQGEHELIPSEWLTKIEHFKTQLNIQKNIQVFLSKQVKEPITFGHFKPLILLPISLITGFDTVAIELMILHELAHIKRHDYLVNLIQSIIEIIFFYHPLVWWLSRDIRELREHCCDDLVLSLGDNRTTYVETLTALQWRKVGGVSNRLSLSASGSNTGFSRRIKRMFGVEEELGSFRWLMGVFLVLLMVAIGGFTYQEYNNGDSADLEDSSSIYPDKELIYYIDHTYSKEDMDRIGVEIKELGVTLGPVTFSEITTICDDNPLNADVVRTVKGSYYRNYGKTIYFESPDLAQFPIKLTFDGGDLREPDRLTAFGKEAFRTNQFTYESQDEVSFLINENTRKEDLLFWKEKLKRSYIPFSFDESVFDKNDKLVELRGTYKTEEKGSDFFLTNLPCVNAKFELYKDQLSGPTFFYPCKDKKVGQNKSNAKDTLTYLVSNKMTKIELNEMIAKIRAHSQVRIDIDPFKTKYDESDKLVAISGKYVYERFPYNIPIQTFEVGDLGQFQIRFKAHPNASIAPAYYNSVTNKFIQVSDHYSGFGAFAKAASLTGGTLIVPTRTYKDINAVLIINESTNISDLKAFADKILPNNIIFRYQDSEFRPDGTIIKLVGDFLGDSRISEPFFVDDLTQYQVKLRVEKNYIYQPEITQQDSPKPLSYKVINGESLGLDTSLYEIKGKFENHQRNNIAQLIPPFVAVDDSVRALNPIYRNGFDKAAKPVYINGNLTTKKDLPVFLQNQLQAAIKTDIPKTNRYSKTDTTVDWLYWGDQKINLGTAFSKNEKGELEWDIPALKISKGIWDRNKDRPFIFQLKGNWHRAKDLLQIVLLPFEDNPWSMYKAEPYEKAIKNKESNMYHLLSKAKIKDKIYFEQIDIGLDQPVYVMLEIVETSSTNNIPQKEELMEQPKNRVAAGIEVIGRKEINLDTFKNWVQWDNLKFGITTKLKERINEDKTWQTSILEIKKKDWERLYDQPFTFHIDNQWFKVKTIKDIVLVPFKKDPVAAYMHQDYYPILKDKNHRAIKLLAKADVKDHLYFEHINVGKDQTIEMVVHIVDDLPTQSTGFINHINGLIHKTENPNKEDFQAPTFGESKISREQIIRLPTNDVNTQNWIYWGEKKIEWEVVKRKKGFGNKQLESKMLLIQQKDWEALFDKQMTVYYDGHYYNNPDFESIILEKEGILLQGIELGKTFNQEIQDVGSPVFRILKNIEIGQQIILQKMRLGKKIRCDFVIKIVENQPTNVTGFIPKEDIQFQEPTRIADSEPYFIDASQSADEGAILPDLKIGAFLPKTIPATQLGLSRIPPKKTPVYLINGVKYETGRPEKLAPNEIKSMNVQMGLEARSLYGVDEIYIIETKEPFWLGDSTRTLKTVDEVLKPVNDKIKNAVKAVKENDRN